MCGKAILTGLYCMQQRQRIWSWGQSCVWLRPHHMAGRVKMSVHERGAGLARALLPEPSWLFQLTWRQHSKIHSTRVHCLAGSTLTTCVLPQSYLLRQGTPHMQLCMDMQPLLAAAAQEPRGPACLELRRLLHRPGPRR